MGLDEILKSIQDKTEQEYSAIVDEARKKAKEIEAQKKEAMISKKENLLASARQKAEGKIAQAKFQINAKMKAEVLKRKKKHIDALYADAAKKIVSMNDDEKLKLWDPILAKVALMKDVTIRAAKSDKNIIEKLANKHSINVDSETLDTQGGFIARTKDADMDYRLETILENVKKETEITVSQSLFN